MCTANVCRSVMTEALLRARLPATAMVRSVGLVATGAPSDTSALAALAQLGYEAQARPSRRLQPSDLAEADLVLGLAMHHVRDAVVLDRQAFPRTFALAELVERITTSGPRPPQEDLRGWLARLHAGRTTADLMARHSPFDIADPTGGPPEGYLETARDLERLVGDLVTALVPATAPGDAAPPSSHTPPDAEPPEGHDPPRDHQIGGASPVRLVTDALSQSAAHLLSQRVDWVSAGSEAGWRDVGARAVHVAASGQVVFCLTDEPHGAAMQANRDPSTRAVAVADAASARSARNRLRANVFCVSGRLDLSTLLDIAAALTEHPGSLTQAPGSPTEPGTRR